MASGDWQRKVAEWLRGRQGPDDLAVFCVNLAIVVLLVNAFLRTSWLGWAALLLVAVRFRDGDADLMEKYNQQMRKALDHNNFSVFYEANLRFHNVYLDMLDNAEMIHAIKIRKERLYDFPRNKTFVKEWELHSLEEHAAMIKLLKEHDFNGAADYIRDVHWSFSVQERFIRRYYFAKYVELDISEEGNLTVE